MHTRGEIWIKPYTVRVNLKYRLGFVEIYSCGSAGGPWETLLSPKGKYVLYKGGMTSYGSSKNQITGEGPGTPSDVVRPLEEEN